MITLDVVTPSHRIVEGARVSSVTLPSIQGEMTVLPEHSELMAVVGTGVLSFAIDGSESGKVRKFAVSGGFLEVRQDRVTVLAEYCEEAKHIDRSAAVQEQKEAEQALSGANNLTEAELESNRQKLQSALIRQQIAG